MARKSSNPAALTNNRNSEDDLTRSNLQYGANFAGNDHDDSSSDSDHSPATADAETVAIAQVEDPELGKSIAAKEGIERLVLMSGQVYTALHKKRQDLGDTKTAFTKVEQLNPFPFAQLKEALDSYPNLKEIVWCQEEPLNMGSWAHVSPRLETVLKETNLYKDFAVRFCGRDPSASVAAGSKGLHLAQEAAFLKDVFDA